MPLTKQQLLIPRVLCIGGKEGEPNYPGSPYKTGQILYIHTIDMNESDIPKDSVCLFDITRSDFPHLFKPLPWWYGRTVEELPTWVKLIKTNPTYGLNVGAIQKVAAWENGLAGRLICDAFPVFLKLQDIEPADESEYQEYQKQKQ